MIKLVQDFGAINVIATFQNDPEKIYGCESANGVL